MNEQEQEWDLIIKPQNKWYAIDFLSIWRYKDLLFLLVRRDFVSVYKQTILGPFWFLIQPVMTTITLTILGGITGISTDGMPRILFYLSGITLWTYFADCLNKTSNVFVANASVFGKVFFPRLVMPLSIILSNLIKLAVQLTLFLSVWLYFYFKTSTVSPHLSYIWLLPFLIFLMAGLGLGFGVLISSLTTKYRDFTFLIGFAVQLLMYASPIIYPISMVKQKLPEYVSLFLLNPIASIIETFKYIFLGTGYFSWSSLAYSTGFMIVLLTIAIVIFNKVEKSFMDTV